jgi:tol-pal system-associated acyl-CoA thioesterase
LSRSLVLPVRVYLEDTDAQGVVYNASYFRFMERARTEWLRERGIDHEELRKEHGVVLVLAGIEARFRAPARLSDMLYVSADVAEARGARVRFAQSVRREAPDGEILCEGVAEVACMDAREGRPRRLPAPLVSELQQ